jgi:hypothetical protein
MLTYKSEGFKELADSIAALPAQIPDVRKGVLDDMGIAMSAILKKHVAEHTYKGDLGNSIDHKVDLRAGILAIGSDLQRGGRWNAMTLLDEGAGPHTPPFSAIAMWAAVRGIPAGPVWMHIRNHGTKGHKVLDSTMQDPEFQMALDDGARKLGEKLIATAFKFRKGSTE